MNKKIFGIALSVVLILVVLFFSVTPIGRGVWNKWFYGVQKVDDVTNYNTRKQVEDSCRVMIASYTSDKLIYEQYKDSNNEEKQSWGEQAMMRANKTAASYNEYVLKNTYVWNGNIPPDIHMSLLYLD